ncbi:hypothetical protein MES4922_80005 [Mesorhizobium ventifaucium]|uniref:Uncharacterized protein n=1 Tax=Mesorhizobium ventifaucium TaxID=666020 RepID=A0ABN8KDT2_9HYPH|nr:hypothetical protein MES4922_80005 [Mesorhizobium ventifaucium]
MQTLNTIFLFRERRLINRYAADVAVARVPVARGAGRSVCPISSDTGGG